MALPLLTIKPGAARAPALEDGEGAETGVVNEQELGTFLTQKFERTFRMPINVYEMQKSEGEQRVARGMPTSRKVDWTPHLKDYLTAMGNPRRLELELGYDYMGTPVWKSDVRYQLTELLYLIMSMPESPYDRIYVEKVPGVADASEVGKILPRRTPAMIKQGVGYTDTMVKVFEFNSDRVEIDYFPSMSLHSMIAEAIGKVDQLRELWKAHKMTAADYQQAMFDLLNRDPVRIYISKGPEAEHIQMMASGPQSANRAHHRAVDDLADLMAASSAEREPMQAAEGEPMEAAFDAFPLGEAETGMCWPGKDYRACMEKQRTTKADKTNRQVAMTRLGQLLNMFYDMTKHPDHQSRNEGKTADQLWTALKTHYTNNEALLAPNFLDQAKAAWLKTAEFGEAARMADTARDMQTFQNDVLVGQMGFKKSADSFAKASSARWTKAGK